MEAEFHVEKGVDMPICHSLTRQGKHLRHSGILGNRGENL